MNKTVMQSVKKEHYLHKMTFVKVVLVHYNVNYVTFQLYP